ncbi:hypothetical protein CBL_08603 [Carabus blaptoides fortunei]
MARRGQTTFHAPYNSMLQQSLSTFPAYHRGAKFAQQSQPFKLRNLPPDITSSPVPQAIYIQQSQAMNSTFLTTPSPTSPREQHTQALPPSSPSPGCSNDTAHSYYSNFSTDLELYDL